MEATGDANVEIRKSRKQRVPRELKYKFYAWRRPSMGSQAQARCFRHQPKNPVGFTWQAVSITDASRMLSYLLCYSYRVRSQRRLHWCNDNIATCKRILETLRGVNRNAQHSSTTVQQITTSIDDFENSLITAMTKYDAP